MCSASVPPWCKRALLAIAVFALFVSATPPTLQTVFAHGETLDFDLTWLRVSGGSARMTIAPDGNGSRFRISSVAASSPSFSKIYRVRDEVESVVTRDSFSTLSYTKMLREGSRRKDETTTIERGLATRKGMKTKVPDPVFDPLSLIYYVRTLDLSPGKSHHFDVYADGKLYGVEATVLRRETIVTPAGKFQCVVVSPEMEQGGIFRDEKGRLTIWYSDDEYHLPVRITSEVKIGSISATLRRIGSGVTTSEPTFSAK